MGVGGWGVGRKGAERCDFYLRGWVGGGGLLEGGESKLGLWTGAMPWLSHEARGSLHRRRVLRALIFTCRAGNDVSYL